VACVGHHDAPIQYQETDLLLLSEGIVLLVLIGERGRGVGRQTVQLALCSFVVKSLSLRILFGVSTRQVAPTWYANCTGRRTGTAISGHPIQRAAYLSRLQAAQHYSHRGRRVRKAQTAANGTGVGGNLSFAISIVLFHQQCNGVSNAGSR
jgi:hypothetical protein